MSLTTELNYITKLSLGNTIFYDEYKKTLKYPFSYNQQSNLIVLIWLTKTPHQLKYENENEKRDRNPPVATHRRM